MHVKLKNRLQVPILPKVTNIGLHGTDHARQPARGMRLDLTDISKGRLDLS
jgi:hypothetical protein